MYYFLRGVLIHFSSPPPNCGPYQTLFFYFCYTRLNLILVVSRGFRTSSSNTEFRTSPFFLYQVFRIVHDSGPYNATLLLFFTSILIIVYDYLLSLCKSNFSYLYAARIVVKSFFTGAGFFKNIYFKYYKRARFAGKKFSWHFLYSKIILVFVQVENLI